MTFIPGCCIIVINLRIMEFGAYCKRAHSGIDKQIKTCVCTNQKTKNLKNTKKTKITLDNHKIVCYTDKKRYEQKFDFVALKKLEVAGSSPVTSLKIRPRNRADFFAAHSFERP